MHRDRTDRVLVTRSEPGAGTLARALEAAGFEPVVCPLIDVRERLPDASLLQALDRFAAAIFVSGHAVRWGVPALRRHWPAWPGHLQWLAVGDATALALAAHGIRAVHPGEETSEGILAMPELGVVAGRRVLIVCGAGGRQRLANELTERGAYVSKLEVYERIRVTSAASLRAIHASGIDAAVVSSTDGGRAFAALWEQLGAPKDLRIIVPSERVRDTLFPLGFERTVSSAGAGPAAVIAALRSSLETNRES